MEYHVFKLIQDKFPNNIDIAFNVTAVLFGYRSATLIQSGDYISKDDKEFYNKLKLFLGGIIQKHNDLKIKSDFNDKYNKIGFNEFNLDSIPELIIYAVSYPTIKEYKKNLQLLLDTDIGTHPKSSVIGTILGYLYPGSNGEMEIYTLHYIFHNSKTDKKHNIYAEICKEQPKQSILDEKKEIFNILSKKLNGSLIINVDTRLKLRDIKKIVKHGGWEIFKKHDFDIANYFYNEGLIKTAYTIYESECFTEEIYNKYKFFWKILIKNSYKFDNVYDKLYKPYTREKQDIFNRNISGFEDIIYDNSIKSKLFLVDKELSSNLINQTLEKLVKILV